MKRDLGVFGKEVYYFEMYLECRTYISIVNSPGHVALINKPSRIL